MLRGLAEGVEGLSMKAGPGLGGATAVVAYSSHHTASMAKKKLVEGESNNCFFNMLTFNLSPT